MQKYGILEKLTVFSRQINK